MSDSEKKHYLAKWAMSAMPRIPNTEQTHSQTLKKGVQIIMETQTQHYD